ncbi:Sulfate permease, MFS superfamily [Sphingomonas laterariae]|uniref:Sulfate permease, MFS superfamily n=1 Tax=Edaphosphingomonas laterariae TaxID=861865 RepID=A0A239CVJ6_9SPHN|nr:SulP family inorganic anion transporter [Sphingomonas laterariae]SNS23949.1 Sulfate permease, MFS superfamily [Sphingomonas laterariae]
MANPQVPANWFARDLTASIVVFLVAMPLCMGIAIASGVPPEKGLITGIIGGIVVGLLAGSPLQVSGPAAGLAVIVFEIVQRHGLAALGPILVVAGIIQFLAGVFRLGGWFRAISPAVVHGMLAGIGVLIVVGQFHVLFDAKPLASGLENLVAIPGRILGLWPADGHPAVPALLIGLVAIGCTLAWDKLRPASLRLLPGALVGVVVATLSAYFIGLDVARVDVPESIVAAIATPTMADLSGMLSPTLMVTAVAIAFIASAETLLSAAAVDRMHDGARTDYNRELRAQGVGNLLCGAAGALPMTGVIVRSSANVQAGAVTRMSAVLHGIWILGLVAALPWLLREIPMAALGGILVVTGWKLVSLQHVRHLFRAHGPLPAVIWAATLVMVVATDLLTGVLVGLGLSLIEVIPNLKRLKLDVAEAEHDHGHELKLAGVASFVSLPKLSTALDALPTDKRIHMDLGGLRSIDHTCAELLTEWWQRRRARGGDIEIRGAQGRLATMLAAH